MNLNVLGTRILKLFFYFRIYDLIDLSVQRILKKEKKNIILLWP